MCPCSSPAPFFSPHFSAFLLTPLRVSPSSSPSPQSVQGSGWAISCLFFTPFLWMGSELEGQMCKLCPMSHIKNREDRWQGSMGQKWILLKHTFANRSSKAWLVRSGSEFRLYCEYRICSYGFAASGYRPRFSLQNVPLLLPGSWHDPATQAGAMWPGIFLGLSWSQEKELQVLLVVVEDQLALRWIHHLSPVHYGQGWLHATPAVYSVQSGCEIFQTFNLVVW